MGIFFGETKRTNPSTPPSDGVSRPTAWQHFTGSGEFIEVLKAENKKIHKEYSQQKDEHRKNEHLRNKKFAERLEEDKKSYFLNARLYDLASRPPTEEELKKERVRMVTENYNEHLAKMQKEFKKSERNAKINMTREYHHKLGKTSRILHREGPDAFRSQDTGPMTFGRRIFGTTKSRGLKNSLKRGRSLQAA